MEKTNILKILKFAYEQIEDFTENCENDENSQLYKTRLRMFLHMSTTRPSNKTGVMKNI